MEKCGSFDEGDEIFLWDDIQVINFLLEVIYFATNMWGKTDEEMFQYGPTIIFSADIL